MPAITYHWQMPDGNLACGQPHRQGVVGCCRLDPKYVSCPDCRGAIDRATRDDQQQQDAS